MPAVDVLLPTINRLPSLILTLAGVAARDFAAIWHGDAYTAFRAELASETPPAVCRSCAVYSGTF